MIGQIGGPANPNKCGTHCGTCSGSGAQNPTHIEGQYKWDTGSFYDYRWTTEGNGSNCTWEVGAGNPVICPLSPNAFALAYPCGCAPTIYGSCEIRAEHLYSYKWVCQ